MNKQVADDSETWREKYLSALDAQEALEFEAREQFRQLRRALVQLSVVALGQDPDLDDVLDQLRRALRSDDAPERFPEVAEALDRQVRVFESNREQFDAQILKALTALVAQLQSLGPSRSLKRELSHYASRLPARSQTFKLFPALLQQLGDLQQQALAELGEHKPGLLGRLRGERSGEPEGSEALQLEVSQMLESLLSAINSEYMGQEVIEPLAAQAQQGIPLRDLPGFLERVRDVVMRSWLSANQVFASYLNAVNDELEAISKVLGGAVEKNASLDQANRSFHTNLEERCESLAGSVDNARDLQQLKSQVSSQLGQIRDSLTQIKQVEAQEGPLTDQLEQLVTRVQTMEKEAEENRASLRRHRHKALHDPLTQLPNREAYEERLLHEVQRWQRYGHPLTLAVCDVDHFKGINDQFGHQAGDRVLKVISRAIGRRLREVDFFGRYGGEEFVILMPETDSQAALVVLDEVRGALEKTAFHYRQEPLTVTVSIGLAQFAKDETGDQVFGRADRALYSAKAAGRNRCQVG